MSDVTPQGVIGMLVVDGALRLVVTDFDGAESNGFSQLSRQKSRCRAKMGVQLIKKYGGPVIERILDRSKGSEMLYSIINGECSGIEYKEILIGYEESENNV